MIRYSSHHNFYNKNLRDFANQNRHSATKSEASLWKYVLRSRKMRGLVFNRQRPVLGYIVDFMSKKIKLIIEADGITHESEEARERDRIRQNKLEEAGFTVIRFSDEEILNNIDAVEKKIGEVVDGLLASPSLPLGEGDNLRSENRL